MFPMDQWQVADLMELMLDPQVRNRECVALATRSTYPTTLCKDDRQELVGVFISIRNANEFRSKEMMSVSQSTFVVDIAAFEGSADGIVNVDVALLAHHLTVKKLLLLWSESILALAVELVQVVLIILLPHLLPRFGKIRAASLKDPGPVVLLPLGHAGL